MWNEKILGEKLIQYIDKILRGVFLLEIPEEDKKILLQLIDKKEIPEKLIIRLVKKAIAVRYQDKVIGFKDEISDLIKEYANDKKANS